MAMSSNLAPVTSASSRELRQLDFEVSARFACAQDANELLYAPLAAEASLQRSRVYRIEYSGEQEQLVEFFERVAVDAIAQSSRSSSERSFVYSDWDFCLERSMKRGALDHEKEAIMAYYFKKESRDFVVNNLLVIDRFYVFFKQSNLPPQELAKPFVRDLINDAVQNHELIVRSGCSR